MRPTLPISLHRALMPCFKTVTSTKALPRPAAPGPRAPAGSFRGAPLGGRRAAGLCGTGARRRGATQNAQRGRPQRARRAFEFALMRRPSPHLWWFTYAGFEILTNGAFTALNTPAIRIAKWAEVCNVLSHCGGLQLAQATLDRLKADHGAVARRPATLSAALEDEAPRGGGQGGPELKRTTWSMGFFRLWLGSECHSRSYYPGQLHGSFPGAFLKGQRLIWSLPKPV